MKRNKKSFNGIVNFSGFTLAEVIAIIILLGVVAIITLSPVIQQTTETAKKSKIKKAMLAYDTMINKLIVENDLKTNNTLIDFGNGCNKAIQYFKVSDKENDCIFKTTDNVWWDITDIRKPMVALKKDDLVSDKAFDIKDTDAFYFIAHFDNQGSLRVNDNAYEKFISTNSDIYNSDKITEKLFAYVYNKEIDSRYLTCDYDCVVKKVEKYREKTCESSNGGGSGDGCTNCGSCFVGNGYSNALYDENGNVIAHFYNCTNNSTCENSSIYEDIDLADGGHRTITKLCDNKGENCYSASVYETNSDGYSTISRTGCNENGEDCEESIFWIRDENNKVLFDKSGCNMAGTECKNVIANTYNEQGKMLLNKAGCNNNGTQCTRCMSFNGAVCKKNSNNYYDPEDTVYD